MLSLNIPKILAFYFKAQICVIWGMKIIEIQCSNYVATDFCKGNLNTDFEGTVKIFIVLP